MLKRANDCMVGMTALLKPGAMKGHDASDIPVFNEHYTCRLRNTTIITGYPSSGKSFLAMNLQAALTAKHQWKHFLYTPEMGNADEIYLTLFEIITGHSVGFGLTEQMITDNLRYINEHFLVFEPDTVPTMSDLVKLVHEAKEEFGIQTFSIDNMNDLRHNIVGTQDIYFEDQLLTFNNAAKTLNVHGFLLAHPAKPSADDLDLPPPPDKIKGGSAFWSKGQTIMSLRDAEEYLHVAIYKAKPRYVAKKGDFLLKKEYKRSTYSINLGGLGDKQLFMFPQIGRPVVEKPPVEDLAF